MRFKKLEVFNIQTVRTATHKFGFLREEVPERGRDGAIHTETGTE